MGEHPKIDLRRRLRAARRALDPAVRAAESVAVAQQVIRWLAVERPPALASYLALSEELSLDAVHTWWWGEGHALWLPRVIAPGQLSWHAVTDLAQVRSGAYGIREPDPELAPAGVLPPAAAMLVPGVGFTTEGARLGMGGGFYDRLLAARKGPTIGVAFGCQRCAELPGEAHDQAVGQVLFGS